MTLRRTPTLLLAGALALALAACDAGGGEPTTKPTTSTTTTSAPAETSSAPSEEPSTPAAAAPNPADYPGMDKQTEEGAKQAYKYFWDTISFAYQSGDSRSVSALHSMDCTYCTKTTRAIDGLRDRNALWGPANNIYTEEVIETYTPEKAVVTLAFNLTAHEESSDDFSTRTMAPEARYATAGQLIWENDRWIVAAVDIAQ